MCQINQIFDFIQNCMQKVLKKVHHILNIKFNIIISCPQLSFLPQNIYSSYNKYNIEIIMYSNEKCRIHPDYIYTNFCSSLLCTKPLCPICVQDHYRQHKQLETQPKIQSLRTLKQKCSTKMKNILEQLQYVKSKFNSPQYNLNILMQKRLQELNEIRQIVFRTINQYFNIIQSQLKSKFQALSSKQIQYKQQQKNTKKLVQKFYTLNQKLQNNIQFINTCIEILKLQIQNINLTVKNQFLKVQNLSKQLDIKVNFNQQLPRQIYTQLSNSILSVAFSSQIICQKLKKINPLKLSLLRNQFNKSTKKQNIQQQENKKLSLQKNKDKFNIKTMYISINETFKTNTKLKYLHYFENNSNKLYYINLLQPGLMFQTVIIENNFNVPADHQSISTSDGNLYLIGGNIHNYLKSPKIFKYHFQKKILVFNNNLKYPRSNHRLCQLGKYIYIIGGITNNHIITNKCERFDLLTGRVQQISDCLISCHSFALCSYQNKYLFKFGGIDQNEKKISSVQQYDQKTNNWYLLKFVIPKGLKICSNQVAVQINSKQIMVLGGIDNQDKPVTQTYIFEINEQQDIIIKQLNSHQLIFYHPLCNTANYVIYRQVLYILQKQENQKQSYQRVIAFDGRNWKTIG